MSDTTNTITRGSWWGRWDLHIHTPASIVQHYGEDNEETWEKYITDLFINKPSNDEPKSEKNIQNPIISLSSCHLSTSILP